MRGEEEDQKKWVSVGPTAELNKKIQYADQAFLGAKAPGPPPVPAKPGESSDESEETMVGSERNLSK